MLIFILVIFSLDFALPEDNISKRPELPSQPQPQQKPMIVNVNKPIKQSSTDYYPFNLTIVHLSPRSIEISWTCRESTLNDRYEVTIKPVLASYKVVETVPNNYCYLVMDKLEPDTTYQVAVTSITGRTRRRSGYVIFRTFMEADYTEFADVGGDDQFDEMNGPEGVGGDDLDAKGQIRLPRVRFVEISLISMALILWAGAIILFFHRWGKIRMLLPYQPDYKEMKNTTALAPCTTCSMTPHHQCQKIQHLQTAPVVPADCLIQAQGVTTTTMNYHHHPPPPLLLSTTTSSSHAPHHHHLPHQPMSEPGPSGVSGAGAHHPHHHRHHSHVNVVQVAETGCSPIRYKIPYFNEEGDISIDMMSYDQHQHPPPLHRQLNNIQRKARSAEQLRHYASPQIEHEPNELECTEF